MCGGVAVENRGDGEERGRNGSVVSVEKATVLSSSTRHRFTCQQRERGRVCFHFGGIKEEQFFFLSKRLAAHKTQTMTKRGQFL